MHFYDEDFDYAILSKKNKKRPRPATTEEEEGKDNTSTEKNACNGLTDVEANKYSSYIYSNRNNVYFYTSINNFSCVKFLEQVDTAVEFIQKKTTELSALGITQKLPLVLYINSPGGSVFSVFSMIDRLRLIKRDYNLEIHSVIEGRAASAATLLSITADRRFAMKYSYMLIHQLSSFCGGKYNEISDDKENLDELMRRIKELYAEFAKVPKTKIDEILKHDLYWNANTCLKYGLIDEII